MVLLWGIQEYIARDANNIALVEDEAIRSHPIILYNYYICDFQCPLSYEAILALLLYTDFLSLF